MNLHDIDSLLQIGEDRLEALKYDRKIPNRFLENVKRTYAIVKTPAKSRSARTKARIAEKRCAQLQELGQREPFTVIQFFMKFSGKWWRRVGNDGFDNLLLSSNGLQDWRWTGATLKRLRDNELQSSESFGRFMECEFMERKRSALDLTFHRLRHDQRNGSEHTD